MQNYLLVHRTVFLENITNCISVICNFKKCFPKKHAFGGDAKTQVLYYQALAFFSISKIRNLFTFESALGGGKTCNWHTEWRT